MIFVSTTAYTQSSLASGAKKNSEISVNAFNLLLFQAADFSYERFLTNESSYGVTLLVGLRGDSRFDSPAPYYYENLAIIPYYRIYFGKKPNAGFFAEGFASFSSGAKDYYDYSTEIVYPCEGDKDCYTEYRVYTSIEKFNAFTIGFSIGGKWVTSNQVIFTTFGGIGRAIAPKNGPAAFPRVGVSIGKRY